MHCANCGEELRDGVRFCPTCGVAAPRPPQPVAPAPINEPAPTLQVRRQPSAPPVPQARAPRAPEPDETEAIEQPAAISCPRDQSGPPADATTGGYIPEPMPRRPRTAGGGGRGAPSALGIPGGADFSRLMSRVMRLLRLDTSVFDEVYRDTNATIPVAVLVAALLFISGIGGYFYIDGLISFDRYDLIAHSAGAFFLRSMIFGTIFGVLMWLAWSGVTMLLLNQLTPTKADFLGIARVIGLAFLPLLLSLLMIVNDFFIGLSWIVLAGIAALAVIGVLEAVDVKPGPAWLVTLGGFAVFVIVMTFLGHGFRDLAPGFFVAG